MDEENDLVRLVVVESEVEATFYRGALEEHGIQALVTGTEASAFGTALDGPDEIEVLVKISDYEQAKSIVEELLDEAEVEPIPAWTCVCGEDVDEGFFVCWSCGVEYKSDSQ